MTLPRVVHEVPAPYTPEAYGRRIHGTVLMQCVVEADGSVGDVRVVRSLDPTYGLDDQAVKAAQRWRFEPATKDGVPVPAVVMIELGFGQSGSWFARAAMPSSRFGAASWPDGFPALVAGSRTGAHWKALTVASDRLEATLAHPPNWEARDSSGLPQGSWFALVSSDGACLVLVSLPTAPPLELPPRGPRSPKELKREQRRLEDAFRQAGKRAVVHGVGDLDLGGGSWSWDDYSAPAADVAPRLRSLAFGTEGNVRVWVFHGRVQGQFVNMFLRVAHRESSEEGAARRERGAQADFAAILASLSFKSR